MNTIFRSSNTRKVSEIQAKQDPRESTLAGLIGRRITLTLPSGVASVNRLERAAEELATNAGLDEDSCFGVTMAVREAAANAVVHGNERDEGKTVTASFENTGRSLIFCIADEGKGLDPDSIPDPLAPENILRGSGRGIFLIRSYMDEVHFRQLHPGTELTLIKYLQPPQETELSGGSKA